MTEATVGLQLQKIQKHHGTTQVQWLYRSPRRSRRPVSRSSDRRDWGDADADQPENQEDCWAPQTLVIQSPEDCEDLQDLEFDRIIVVPVSSRHPSSSCGLHSETTSPRCHPSHHHCWTLMTISWRQHGKSIPQCHVGHRLRTIETKREGTYPPRAAPGRWIMRCRCHPRFTFGRSMWILRVRSCLPSIC